MNVKNRAFYIRFACIAALSLTVALPLVQISRGRVVGSGFVPVGELASGMTVAQRFVAERNGLNGVSFPLATCARTNSVHLLMSVVRCADDAVLVERELDCEKWVDNAVCRMSFPREDDSKGREYELRLVSPDGKPGNAVTVWTIPVADGESECSRAGEALSQRTMYLSKGYDRTPLSVAVAAGVFFFFIALWVLECFKTRRSGHGNGKQKAKSTQFDWGMHYFRGFAIVCIMIMHSLSAFGHGDVDEAFFRSSTVYFLFISGYLCQFLAFKKLDSPCAYLKKKLQNVISPYLFFSALTWLAIWLSGSDRLWCVAWDVTDRMCIGDFVGHLLCGKMQSPYWYIPFVSVLFLLSPVFVRLTNRKLIGVTVAAGAAAIIFPSRGGFDPLWPGVPLMYTYFSVYYLIGFVYCRYRERIDDYLVRNVWVLLGGFLLIGMWVLYPDTLGFCLNGTDLRASFQKLLMTGVALVVFQRFRNVRVRILDALAKYSFTMFFIHAFFLQAFVDLQRAIENGMRSSGLIALCDVLLVVAFVFAMLGVSVVLKTAFGRYSRSFVGS